ncbi:hypothetical protein GCK72_003490 [Caenorhabditis remanei]|uniref:Secreted protein n=1 Tax=Caenorhabditis remanei TaxID=31234 RepID=A0A6A5HYB6_CAERE|nr:hypothetical protein GCK72_003490 [Caenorhabditis remanei]KAF1771663.1 hypothetical protein GCK72_003490 [Caenorhabditis remanei]
MQLFIRFLSILTILVVVTVAGKIPKNSDSEKLTTTTELSNLQIQVNSPNGAGFVHSALPIEARALGARLHGGKSKPTINDDVLIPFDDPDFQ